jgi:hypothetical protein
LSQRRRRRRGVTPQSAAGRRRLPRRRLRRGEAQGGGHELCTYVHRSRSVLVLACLLARAAAGCASPRRALCTGLLGAGVPRLNVVLSAGPCANAETQSCSCCWRSRRGARAAMQTDSSGRASVHCSSLLPQRSSPSKQLSSYTSSTVS